MYIIRSALIINVHLKNFFFFILIRNLILILKIACRNTFIVQAYLQKKI